MTIKCFKCGDEMTLYENHKKVFHCKKCNVFENRFKTPKALYGSESYSEGRRHDDNWDGVVDNIEKLLEDEIK